MALGLQRGSRRAVLGALVPLATGHAAAIGAVVAIAAALGLVASPALLRMTVAVLLIGLGGWRLVRARHPRFGGMQVSGRELVVWSFLMASAHGAGLMVLPVILHRVGPSVPAAHQVPMHHAAMSVALPGGEWGVVMATAAHSVGYLVITALLAVLVYERLGLRLLRTVWINVDLIWAVALVAAGAGTLLR